MLLKSVLSDRLVVPISDVMTDEVMSIAAAGEKLDEARSSSDGKYPGSFVGH
jgi:hypothetical protein